MAANSKIEWTTHTFNPWRGCTKVSDGCKNCYAKTLSGRNPAVLGVWGPNGTRVIASEAMWHEPIKWNQEAERAGRRDRVFCASLADVFEGQDTMPASAWGDVQKARYRLFLLISDTPHLDWLLLTKRPENILPWFHSVLDQWLTGNSHPADYEGLNLYDFAMMAGIATRYRAGQFLPNVWMGTSVENQKAADERIPHLLKVPAPVRFLSCEPLLGPVDLRHVQTDVVEIDALTGDHGVFRPLQGRSDNKIHWVIAGGESGDGARPMDPEWVRSLRDQCASANIPFFFKQWGDLLPFEETAQQPFWLDQRGIEHDGHGLNVLDPETGELGKGWHAESLHQACAWKRVGKKIAGRLLDGNIYNGFPVELAKV